MVVLCCRRVVLNGWLISRLSLDILVKEKESTVKTARSARAVSNPLHACDVELQTISPGKKAVTPRNLEVSEISVAETIAGTVTRRRKLSSEQH